MLKIKDEAKQSNGRQTEGNIENMKELQKRRAKERPNNNNNNKKAKHRKLNKQAYKQKTKTNATLSIVRNTSFCRVRNPNHTTVKTQEHNPQRANRHFSCNTK